MDTHTDTTPRGPRYTARLVLLEEPQVAEQIGQLAHRNGHSVAAEVRAAIRDHLARAGRPR
jgi:hypothetical protein